MAEKGLSSGDVAGTGRDGRITKGDVLSAGQAAPAPAAKAAPAPAARTEGCEAVAAGRQGARHRPTNG